MPLGTYWARGSHRPAPSLATLTVAKSPSPVARCEKEAGMMKRRYKALPHRGVRERWHGFDDHR